jgi:type I restriction enzyme M protein
MAITDCIFRLRVPGTLRRAVLRALTSSEGRAFLRSVSRGAGAQYLSRSAILELPIR